MNHGIALSFNPGSGKHKGVSLRARAWDRACYEPLGRSRYQDPGGWRRSSSAPWFRGGLVFKAHRPLYHSTLGSRVIKKKTTPWGCIHGGRVGRVGIATGISPLLPPPSINKFQFTTSETHPGGNPGATLQSSSHRCFLFEVAFVWELTEEIIVLPLGCLLGCLLVHQLPVSIAPAPRKGCSRVKGVMSKGMINLIWLPH
jgi:hypothetical protein